MDIFVSRRDRNATLLWVAVLLVGVVVLYLLVRQFAPFLVDPQELRAWIRQFGPLAPLAFIAVQILQTVIAPIPGQVTGVIGGLLFGAVAGTLLSLVGGTLGSALAFWLSRRYGRTYVENVVTPSALEQFDTLGEEYGLPGLFVGFVVPGLPDDVLCFVGGLTDIPLWKLVTVAFVGRIPSYALVSILGNELAAGHLATVLGLTALLLVVAILGYRFGQRFLAR